MTGRTAYEAGDPAIGWPLPTWGAALGLLFLYLMVGKAGAVVGFLVAMASMMVVLPLVSLGVPVPGLAAGGVILFILFAGLAIPQALTAAQAPTRARRKSALDWLTLTVCVGGGVAVSTRSMVQFWP